MLIHGVTQRAKSSSALAERLAEAGFTVYGLDQRGHGHWRFATGYSGGQEANFEQTVKDVSILVADAGNRINR